MKPSIVNCQDENLAKNNLNKFLHTISPNQIQTCSNINENLPLAPVKNPHTIPFESNPYEIQSNDDPMQNTILFEDPFEGIISSNINYETFTVILWFAFHIVIFLAIVYVVKKLFVFYICTWKQKQKTADDAHNTIKCIAKFDDSKIDEKCLVNDWESELIDDENLLIVPSEHVLWISKQHSFKEKRMKLNVYRKKRACVSVGPVLMHIQCYGQEFAFLKIKNTNVLTQEHQRGKKKEESKRDTAYYVCVIIFIYIYVVCCDVCACDACIR